MVTGDASQVIDFTIANLTGAPVRLRQEALNEEQEDDLDEFIAIAGIGYLIDVQLRHDEAFLQELGAAWDRARFENFTRQQWIEKVTSVANKWGGTTSTVGPVARTWLENAVTIPLFDAAQREVLAGAIGQKVFPYIMVRTRADGKVRPNHFKLHGFVARADWSGWAREASPPYGWGCRCRPIWFGISEVKKLGWTTLFPMGLSKLSAFRAAGGSDAGFPRVSFVTQGPL